ncbi:MFS transporter [Jannaschia seosinensis]|uniref:MFS transporter n=1 Tax=Jannaschia seosinensis TaxID=313367 RepID=UPI001FE027F4|nr:MFS transporter [Jannaschia seosinensis]
MIALTSTFGQTVFIAIFAGKIMTAFGLSDGDWGLIYTVATGTSAVAMVFAGTLADRLRIRVLAVMVCLGLATACLAMAVTTGPAVLIVVIFALRFFGQGMMSHLAAVAMARWFVAARGKALSIASLGFAFGQTVLPILFVAMFAVADWRTLWVGCAALTLMSIPVLLRLLRAERTPQSLAAETASAGMSGQHWTRLQVLRTPLFWSLVPLLLGPPAFGTALFFHQVHLAGVKDWTLPEFVALLPLYSGVAVTVTLLSGVVLDRIGSALLVQLYMLPFAVAFLVLSTAETLWGAGLALVILGVGAGAQATVPTAFWAEFYGTRHIGSIKAMSTAIMVLGTAIGPGLTGVVIDRGIELPQQMVAISLYFAAAGAIAALAVWRARSALPAKVDVISA